MSLQTSAFAHDGENELEQNKIFNGIENYDVISISQPGVLYYSVTNQILESVKNLGSRVTFIGRANIGLHKVLDSYNNETLVTNPDYLYSLSVKNIENKYSDYDCYKKEEDLNRKHNLTLTEGQISTILYTMEGYMQGSDDAEDSDFHKDVDSIFEVLETTIDKFYDKLAKLKASKPKPEWD